MSLAEIVLPAPPSSGLGLGLTVPGLMPILRSSARSMLAFLACCSPFIFLPRLSVPSQTNIGMVTPSRTGLLAVPRVAVLAAERVTAIGLSPGAVQLPRPDEFPCMVTA